MINFTNEYERVIFFYFDLEYKIPQMNYSRKAMVVFKLYDKNMDGYLEYN